MRCVILLLPRALCFSLSSLIQGIFIWAESMVYDYLGKGEPWRAWQGVVWICTIQLSLVSSQRPKLFYSEQGYNFDETLRSMFCFLFSI